MKTYIYIYKPNYILNFNKPTGPKNVKSKYEHILLFIQPIKLYLYFSIIFHSNHYLQYNNINFVLPYKYTIEKNNLLIIQLLSCDNCISITKLKD